MVGGEGGERDEGVQWLLVFRGKSQVSQSPVVHMAFGLRQDIPWAIGAETTSWGMVCPAMDVVCEEFTGGLWL